MRVEGRRLTAISLLVFRNRFSVSLHELLQAEPGACSRASAGPSHCSSCACSLASGRLPGHARSGTHAREEGRHPGWYQHLCSGTLRPPLKGFTATVVRVRVDRASHSAMNPSMWHLFHRSTGLPTSADPGISAKEELTLGWRPSWATVSLPPAPLSLQDRLDCGAGAQPCPVSPAAGVYRYDRESGRADAPNTSCLSPYLHFGQLSPRWLLWDARGARCRPPKFQRKLAWRDLASWQLTLFPELPWEPLRPPYKVNMAGVGGGGATLSFTRLFPSNGVGRL